MNYSKLTVGAYGGDVCRLHSLLRKEGFQIPESELTQGFFGPETRRAVLAFQARTGAEKTGYVDETMVAALGDAPASSHIPNLASPAPSIAAIREARTATTLTNLARSNLATDKGSRAPASSFSVPAAGSESRASTQLTGQVFMEEGLPARDVTLRLYRTGFGGVATRIGEVGSDASGGYALPLGVAGAAGQLEVRVLDAQGNEIPISARFSNAEVPEALNLVAPASVQMQAPEFFRLANDLKSHVGALSELAKTQENEERSDLTLLHDNTGWDSRLIAVAANAVKLRAEVLTERQIDLPEDGLYAMLRAGLPSGKEELARVSVGTVEEALKKASAAGVTELGAQRIAEITSKFQTFSREIRLTAKAPGAISTYRELLSRSGLNDDKQEKFADLYLAHQGTPAELWKKAEDEGFEKQEIDNLRLQGKLAYLTSNNADVVQSLQGEFPDADDLSVLVEKDLHKPEAWKARMQQLAGNDPAKLTQLVPPAFATVDAYAEDMARKVETSFPNHVVARIVKDEKLLESDEDADALHDFLTTAAKIETGEPGKKGYKLGEVAVDTLIPRHWEKFFPVGTPQETIEKTTKAARLVQRVYQFTPSNDAMKVLLSRGLTSARDVTAISKNEFLNRYGKYFLSAQDAALVYDKASQVSAVTENVANAAKQLGRGAQPFAIGGTSEKHTEATKKLQAQLLKHYPTMESLFGSMDFCECEHCRSVLSPAAYLVDLLAFIDPDQKTVWDGFLEDWKSKHNGVAYSDPPYEFMKPFDAFVKRRPDLPYLPLTCENTNTALPYIDLVNEILEFQVAHGGLTKSAARDTGNATTSELLAEPQNVIAAAYDQLSAARYPLVLPFDLWLETVRRFLEYFETPLWEVLEAFRTTDKLRGPEPPEDPKPSCYRAEIFIEQLGLSPSEYALFTDPERLENWHLLYGFDDSTKTAAENQQEALDVLRSAKALSRRLGVTYKEIVELVQTSFVNPGLAALAFLPRLGVSADDFLRYKEMSGHALLSVEEKAVFEQRLADRAEELKLTVEALNARLETAWAAAKTGEILVLRDPNTACDFDQTTLEYADASPADGLALLKLNLFVRLWKKLGWTIAETDRAMQTFLPASMLPLTLATIGPALETALLYLAHLKALDAQVKVGRNSRVKLLTLWSDLPTTGPNPLYAQLFLTRSVLKNDVIFDDPLGDYLSPSSNLFLKDHLVAVQGALGVTADEVGRILADSKGMPASKGASLIESEPLTLATVSLIYRHGLLAKALKLSVADFITLKALSGLDPLKLLSGDRALVLDDDFPFTQTLQFVESAALVSETGFNIEDLNYLLRHRFDPVGRYRRDPSATLALVKSLALEIRRIRTEHAVPADPANFTDEMLQQKLALALPADVATTFFATWAGTKEYEAVTPVPPSQMLAPERFSSEPAVRVSYSEERREQRLAFRGVLLDAKKSQINAAAPSPIVAALLDAVQKQARDFFQAQIQKSGAEEPRIGFLDPGDYETLFATPVPIPDDRSEAEKQALRKQNEALLRAKRKRLAEAFLPFLQEKLIRNFVIQTLAGNLGADPALIESLLADTRMLADPSAPGRRLLDAFAAAREQGFTAEWFASADATGPALDAPDGANSARFSGYLEVPANGAYRFFVTLGKKDATGELRFTHLANALLQTKAAAENAEASEFVDLKAGVPYEFTLEGRNLNAGGITLTVMGENLPKGAIERLALYPGAMIERVRRAYVLLAKTLQLVQTLALSEREVRYLLTHGADFDNLAFSALPTREDGESDSDARLLLAQFLRLAGYVALKRDLAPDSAELIGIFENARRIFPLTQDATAAKDAVLTDLCQRMADITRRKVDTVQATVRQLGIVAAASTDTAGLRVEVPDFAQEKGLARFWRALQIVEKLGVSPEAVSRWATPKPDLATAQNLRDTSRAKYEPENWQRIAQPIFDKLRQNQRDALVAYVLHRHPERFTSANQLFEYFLIDPGMEPVVQTSRIRQATASVQLFVQRCLLNLEKNVHPSAINSKHWQWMKRYRFWEANRKIFLFPENWLEPEFRDDKTHLFQELEGALLQGDVSNDLVEDAFLNYLKKLEELARLEIVTMYCEEKAINPAANTMHVIGRTHCAPRKYFYRQYAQRMWTPWEPVGVEIESNHVVAVMWRDRLHLFWVTFMERPKQPKQDATNPNAIADNDGVGKVANKAANMTVPKDIQAQLSWSEHFQGQWSERRSSEFMTAKEGMTGIFDPQMVSIHVSRDFEDGEETAVRIHLNGAIQKGFKLVSRHSPPGLAEAQQLPPTAYGPGYLKATQYVRGTATLDVKFYEIFEGILPTEGPEICSWGPGRLDLFVRGSDGSPWHRSYFGSWSDWEKITEDGKLVGDPAAVSWDKGRLDLVVRGTDNALHHLGYNQDGWAKWERLENRIFSSSPAVCSWGPERLDVFARGTDNALWHKWQPRLGDWALFESLGGGLTSDPAAVSCGPGRIDVFVRGFDNALWHKWYEGGWSEWTNRGVEPLNSAPAVCSWGVGRLDVFIRGTDNALWHKWLEKDTWSEWESLGGNLASAPAAVSWGEGRIDVVVRGPDDILRHKHFEVEWSDWEEIDSVLHFRPPAGEQPAIKTILQEHREHSLVWASNPSEYVFPEVGELARPFFYQDNYHTFFVEPRVTDTTIELWEEWVISTPVLRPRWVDMEIIKHLPLRAQTPIAKIKLSPELLSPYARFDIRPGGDWLANPRVALEFGQQKIGAVGRLDSVAASLGDLEIRDGAAVSMGGLAARDALVTVKSSQGANIAVLSTLEARPAIAFGRPAYVMGRF